MKALWIALGLWAAFVAGFGLGVFWAGGKRTMKIKGGK